MASSNVQDHVVLPHNHIDAIECCGCIEGPWHTARCNECGATMSLTDPADHPDGLEGVLSQLAVLREVSEQFRKGTAIDFDDPTKFIDPTDFGFPRPKDDDPADWWKGDEQS